MAAAGREAGAEVKTANDNEYGSKYAKNAAGAINLGAA
jgi:hypothetical protein